MTDDLFDSLISADTAPTFDPRSLVVNDDPFDLAGKRGRWGRPIVTTADGATAEYERPSSIAKKLDDKTGLLRWTAGMAVLGAAETPDLADAVRRINLDEDGALKELYRLGEDAKQSASINRGSDWGSLIHQTTGLIERGVAPDIREEIKPAVYAYFDRLETLDLTPIPDRVEQALVNDPLRLAGTADNQYRTGDGRILMGDKKTQKTADPLSWGIQLAIYTSSVPYDIATGARGVADWDKSTALVLHINYRDGAGTCDVYELDMDAFTGALLLALEVDEWRKTAKRHCVPVLRPFEAPAPKLVDRVNAARGHDQQALVDVWTRAGLGKIGDLTPSEQVVACDVLDDLEQQLGLTAVSAADWRARLRRLPTDLRTQAEAELKFGTLSDDWQTQCPEAAIVLQRAETEHTERIGNVTRALDGVDTVNHALATASTPIRALTGPQAERAIAVASALVDGLIDPQTWEVTIDILPRLGKKADALALGRKLAKRHGLKSPAKAADIGTDPVLAALAVAA